MDNKTTKEKRDEKFEFLMAEAMDMFRRLQIRNQIPVKNLEEFAYKLGEALELDDSRVEPYVFLSYVFFQMKKDQLGFEYLKKAKQIDPGFPDIEILKNSVLKHKLYKK
jgi:hypothetical protein